MNLKGAWSCNLLKHLLSRNIVTVARNLKCNLHTNSSTIIMNEYVCGGRRTRINYDKKQSPKNTKNMFDKQDRGLFIWGTISHYPWLIPKSKFKWMRKLVWKAQMFLCVVDERIPGFKASYKRTRAPIHPLTRCLVNLNSWSSVAQMFRKS